MSARRDHVALSASASSVVAQSVRASFALQIDHKIEIGGFRTHGVVSFFFNLTVLALTVNIMSSLM